MNGRTCAHGVGKPVHASTCAPIRIRSSQPRAARNHSVGPTPRTRHEAAVRPRRPSRRSRRAGVVRVGWGLPGPRTCARQCPPTRPETRGARPGYAAGAAGAPPDGHAGPMQARALHRPARRHDPSPHPRYPSLRDHHGRTNRPPGPAVACGARSRRAASCRWGARRGHLPQPLSDPPARRLSSARIDLVARVTLAVCKDRSGVAASRTGPMGPGALPPPGSVPGPPPVGCWSSMTPGVCEEGTKSAGVFRWCRRRRSRAPWQSWTRDWTASVAAASTVAGDRGPPNRVCCRWLLLLGSVGVEHARCGPRWR